MADRIRNPAHDDAGELPIEPEPLVIQEGGKSRIRGADARPMILSMLEPDDRARPHGEEIRAQFAIRRRLVAMAAEEREMERAMKAFEEDADQAKRYIKLRAQGALGTRTRASPSVGESLTTRTLRERWGIAGRSRHGEPRQEPATRAAGLLPAMLCSPAYGDTYPRLPARCFRKRSTSPSSSMPCAR